jgi:hypothetical protein
MGIAGWRQIHWVRPNGIRYVELIAAPSQRYKSKYSAMVD